MLGNIFEIVNNLRSHLRKWGQVFYPTSFQIDPEKMKILVALVVLRVNNELVSLPKVIANIALLIRRDPFSLAACGGPNENVHACFPWREIRERVPVGRKQITAA